MSKSVSDLRKFGFAFGGGLTVLGSLLLWKERAAAPWVLGVAATVALAAAIYPRLLRPLEATLAAIFRLVTMTLTYVILTLIFLFVITPMGLFRRLLGKDGLGLRPDKNRTTYWIPVEPDGPGSRPESPF